jgi:hypothetical protein
VPNDLPARASKPQETPEVSVHITNRLPAWLAAVLCLICATAQGVEAPPQEQKVAPTAFNQEGPQPVGGWGQGEGKSLWVPAADILLFDTVLNRFDYYTIGKHDYDVSGHVWSEHFKNKWVFDNDPFSINQFAHPYQGSMYHGFARSAGLDYWHSTFYTFGGSLFWEEFGENTTPSINDQWTTGIGGSFLGEPLFRMASLLLQTEHGPPGFWHSFGAAVISPATGFNRWAYGDRFDAVFASHDPAVYTRYQLGYNLNSTVKSDVNRNPDPAATPIPQSYRKGEGVSDFTIVYGLPGKPGYTYHRPFDYFHFQFTAATGNALENVISYGSLLAAPLGEGDRYRGIWGLYGTYDYIAPQIFRVSNTGFALGTTGQWWMSETVALQHELLAGGGYGSGGAIRGQGQRDYHHGITPQATASLRWIFSDWVALEGTARGYYITDRASSEQGSEKITRADAGLTFRVFGLHGLTLKYVETHRIANYTSLPDTDQRVGAVSLGYTYLGHRWFGAVDWRPDAQVNKTVGND